MLHYLTSTVDLCKYNPTMHARFEETRVNERKYIHAAGLSTVEHIYFRSPTQITQDLHLVRSGRQQQQRQQMH